MTILPNAMHSAMAVLVSSIRQTGVSFRPPARSTSA